MTPKTDFFLPAPIVALSITPHMISLFTMTSHPSLGDRSGANFIPGGQKRGSGLCKVVHLDSALMSTLELLFGRMRQLKTCFPVHSLDGFKIAGGGMSI